MLYHRRPGVSRRSVSAADAAEREAGWINVGLVKVQLQDFVAELHAMSSFRPGNIVGKLPINAGKCDYGASSQREIVADIYVDPTRGIKPGEVVWEIDS